MSTTHEMATTRTKTTSEVVLLWLLAFSAPRHSSTSLQMQIFLDVRISMGVPLLLIKELAGSGLTLMAWFAGARLATSMPQSSGDVGILWSVSRSGTR